jgi:hypothetical protein
LPLHYIIYQKVIESNYFLLNSNFKGMAVAAPIFGATKSKWQGVSDIV